jgi:Transposase DDE domain
LPAATVCALYKSRWQVELFFKWIKQHLRIKQFFGTSENAVKTQIWIAVSVYVLVAIVKKRLKLEASLYTLLQILSVTLFEKLPLDQALTHDADKGVTSPIGRESIPPERLMRRLAAAGDRQTAQRSPACWRPAGRRSCGRQIGPDNPPSASEFTGSRAGPRLESLHRGPSLDQRTVDREMLARRQPPGPRPEQYRDQELAAMLPAKSRSRFLDGPIPDHGP